MKKEVIENMDTETLKVKVKSATSVLFVSFVLLALYATYILYTMVSETWEPQAPQLIILVLFIAIMLPNMNVRKRMKEELEKRSQNKI
ncbi:MAG: hypothetical protein H0X63_03545 [Flavobacteriales bacterium]|jgi:uncharacterized membrane protein YbjE (DUF340 family)|nr:hypothetical protein [Flavobacteriales bacterium]